MILFMYVDDTIYGSDYTYTYILFEFGRWFFYWLYILGLSPEEYYGTNDLIPTINYLPVHVRLLIIYSLKSGY